MGDGTVTCDGVGWTEVTGEVDGLVFFVLAQVAGEYNRETPDDEHEATMPATLTVENAPGIELLSSGGLGRTLTCVRHFILSLKRL